MNAERLHAICKEVNAALESTGLFNKLNAATKGLQNVVNQPQQPSHQQQFTQRIEQFYEAVSDFPTDNFSPAWRQALDELGGTEILGAELELRVRSALEHNQVTPASALEQIQEMQEQLQGFQQAIQAVIQGFEHLKIGAEELEPGECELGVLVPRDAVHNNIQEFGKELQDLDFLFGTFSELASGERQTYEIKSISSSELMVFIAAIPPVAACVAHAAERIVNLYKTLLEIKKLRGELKKQGLNDDEMKGITDHANTVMKNGIDELTVEIVDEYYQGNDNGRKNELKNSVSISLNKLANRIDQGFNIEVRAEPPEEPEEEPEEGPEEDKTRQQIQRVLDASKTLQFMKIEGGRILHLPEKTVNPKTAKKE
jgi:hypothetical protein